MTPLLRIFHPSSAGSQTPRKSGWKLGWPAEQNAGRSTPWLRYSKIPDRRQKKLFTFCGVEPNKAQTVLLLPINCDSGETIHPNRSLTDGKIATFKNFNDVKKPMEPASPALNEIAHGTAASATPLNVSLTKILPNSTPVDGRISVSTTLTNVPRDLNGKGCADRSGLPTAALTRHWRAV